MPTVLAFERHPVHPAHVEQYRDLIAELVASMRDASGALWADVARAFDDDPSFVVLSEWRTEGDLEAFESGEAVREFADRSDPLLRDETTRRRFRSG